MISLANDLLAGRSLRHPNAFDIVSLSEGKATRGFPISSLYKHCNRRPCFLVLLCLESIPLRNTGPRVKLMFSWTILPSHSPAAGRIGKSAFLPAERRHEIQVPSRSRAGKFRRSSMRATPRVPRRQSVHGQAQSLQSRSLLHDCPFQLCLVSLGLQINPGGPYRETTEDVPGTDALTLPRPYGAAAWCRVWPDSGYMVSP
jgi:hypothetical protein